MTTPFSVCISCSGKVGDVANSSRSDIALGRSSLRTVEWNTISSFVVNALSSPPSLSMYPFITAALLRSVPLNSVCSVKCAIPLCQPFSSLLPHLMLRAQYPTPELLLLTAYFRPHGAIPLIISAIVYVRCKYA